MGISEDKMFWNKTNKEELLNSRIKELSEQVKELRYIITNYITPHDIKVVKNELRQKQLVILELLKIFDYICKKSKIEYWLAYGSLLGAVRHNGFIPWDDDVDIGMMRSDYNRFISLSKKDLDSVDCYINYDKAFDDPIVRLCSKKISGVQIDIFPHDQYYKKMDIEDQILFNKKRKIAHTSLLEAYKKESFVSESEFETKLELLSKKITKQIVLEEHEIDPNGSIFCGIEFDCVDLIDPTYLFPLKTISFEGYEFKCPNNPQGFLKDLYGDYSRWPQKLFRHGSQRIFNEFDSNLEKDYLTFKGIVSSYINQ